MYTHFHSSELDDGSLEQQEQRFRQVVAQLPERPRFLHADNSGAIVRRSPSAWDLVRPGVFLYGLTTSGGMIGLITAMVGGVLIGVLSLIVGVGGGGAVWIGLVGAAVVFAIIVVVTVGTVPRHQARLKVLFPNPDPEGTYGGIDHLP